MNFSFHHFDTIGSTNDEAKRLAMLGEPEGTVVTAETQTAGRGRSGRAWVTPHGSAIAMSLILRPKVPALHTLQVSLLGGLAVLEGIQRLVSLPLQLKWPNDVLVNGKKVAGILAEAAYSGDQLEYVVLGMGVNVNGGPPPDLQVEYEATSLAAEWGDSSDRDALMRSILAAFVMHYPALGTPALANTWLQHLAMRGQPVRVTGMTESVTGVLEGVTGDGSLVVRTEDGGVRTFLTGDVHLREA
jgi:BirA family transcriptional regulator, biotin operon repressor / biotin---[acetyl-CoA-carboxylase] ligase